eukprot:6472349-Amphidinium_carterae.1
MGSCDFMSFRIAQIANHSIGVASVVASHSLAFQNESGTRRMLFVVLLSRVKVPTCGICVSVAGVAAYDSAGSFCPIVDRVCCR